MEKVRKKLMIFGSTGMLGHVVFRRLKKEEDYEIIDVVYRSKLRAESIICDITNKADVSEILLKYKPDIIINCIGVLIKGSLNEPSNAIYINSFFPHFLASEASKFEAKVIHISTDCVFSGKKGGYSENDFKDADDVYGRSKALGELENNQHLTIRTSIIGPELKDNGEGLIHWFLNQNGRLQGYEKAFWGGVTTFECAEAILYSIQNNITGLVNLTNGTSISKYDMLVQFKQDFHRSNISVEGVPGKEVNKSLSSNRNDFEFKVKPYQTMFKEMAEIMLQDEFYKTHYQL